MTKTELMRHQITIRKNAARAASKLNTVVGLTKLRNPNVKTIEREATYLQEALGLMAEIIRVIGSLA